MFSVSACFVFSPVQSVHRAIMTLPGPSVPYQDFTRSLRALKTYIFISNIVMMMSKPYVFIGKPLRSKTPLSKEGWTLA